MIMLMVVIVFLNVVGVCKILKLCLDIVVIVFCWFFCKVNLGVSFNNGLLVLCLLLNSGEILCFCSKVIVLLR